MKKTAALGLLLACSAAAQAAPYGAGFYDTSEYMAGKVAVSVIFPESTGPAENWSPDRQALVVTAIQQAMSWWAAQNPAAHLSFVYLTRTVSTPYEPITCNSVGNGTGPCPNGEQDWISGIMTSLGYSEPDYFDQVYHYDNDVRAANSSDWAFTIFVVDSLNDLDGMFADGYFAYAYLGGPFAVFTYDNENYGIAHFNAVAAHETGHIFYALDEYYGPCATTQHAGYLNGYNLNCENSSYYAPSPCIMRGQVAPYTDGSLCEATRRMIGWSDADGNGKLDVLDLPPTTALAPYSPDPTTNTTLVFGGAARSTAAYVNSNPYTEWTTPRVPNDISIDRLAAVEYRIDGGSWQPASAADGAFDSNSESFSFSANSVADGAHTFAARAKDIFGAYDAVWSTDTVTVNTSNPTDITYVQDGVGSDLDYSSSKGRAAANWGASSHPSGINRYEYSLGRAPGAADVVGWVSVGVTTWTVRSVSLAEGSTYYSSVRAYSNSGLYSGVTTSDGFLVDVTSPTARVLPASAAPARTGPFSAKLVVTEANGLGAAPLLSFRTSTGQLVPLTMSFLTGSTWTASGNVESYHSTGTATFLFGASDPAGNYGTVISPAASFSINYALTGGSSGTVGNSDGFSAYLPQGSYTGTLFVSIATVPASVFNGADPGDSRAVENIDLTRSFTARDLSGSPVSGFSRPVTITLAYPDADNDGRVDSDLTKENTLWVYYLDQAANKWLPLPGVRRDAAANTLSVETDHFSIYSVRSSGSSAAGLGALRLYPNPCDLRTTPYLKIDGVPVDAEGTRVYVYNSAGELVRTLSRDDPAEIDGLNVARWDGTQEKGARAASGLYLFLVKTKNYGKGTGKAFIIW